MVEQNPIEMLRISFRPPRVTTLFVGESAPVNGKFFYQGNTGFYRYVRRAFDGDENFLAAFKQGGFFLDDLVLEPINGLPRSDRRRLHREYASSLAERIAVYKPQAVISVLQDIHGIVGQAIEKSGLINVKHYRLPFPGQGHQTRFMDELRRIRRELPAIAMDEGASCPQSEPTLKRVRLG